jgi:hypothetical protein
LGAHRRQAHGVAGTSATALRSRTNTSSSRRRTAARRKTGVVRHKVATARRGASTRGRTDQGIDRDALLRSLFPNGIPATEEAIRAVNAWLDEGERIARLR